MALGWQEKKMRYFTLPGVDAPVLGLFSAAHSLHVGRICGAMGV
jgi:hypothetical protein